MTSSLPFWAKSGRYVATGSSRSTRPASTCCITAIVVNVLVTDARSKMVSRRIGTCWSAGSSVSISWYFRAFPAASWTGTTPCREASTTPPA